MERYYWFQPSRYIWHNYVLKRIGQNVFEESVYGEIFGYIMRPEYCYRMGTRTLKDGNKTLYPPRPSWVFGPPDEAGDSFSSLLIKASKVACKGGIKKQPILFSSFGFDRDGVPVVVDFLDIRQLLITGASGFGKTKALQALIFTMLWGNSPDIFRLHIFDIKREFSIFSPIARVHKEDEKGEKSGFLYQIKKLLIEMKKVYGMLDSRGLPNIEELNDLRIRENKNPVKYNIIVVDEYASTAAEVEGFSEVVERISCLGRAAGFFLILVTQRADHKAISSRIKSNITNSYSFAQRDAINARVAGVEGAEELSKRGEGILAADIHTKHIKVPFIESKAAKRWIEIFEEEVFYDTKGL